MKYQKVLLFLRLEMENVWIVPLCLFLKNPVKPKFKKTKKNARKYQVLTAPFDK